MAAATGQEKLAYGIQEIPTFAGAVGTWANVIASNLMSFNHTAAAESAVSVHFIPKRLFTPNYTGAQALQKIAVIYSVGTADLSGAPTAVLDQVTQNATTRVTSRVAAVQTLAFTGANTGGITAAGANYAAEVSITTPILLPATDTYVLEMTWPCAATSVLKIFGFELYFQG